MRKNANSEALSKVKFKIRKPKSASPHPKVMRGYELLVNAIKIVGRDTDNLLELLAMSEAIIIEGSLEVTKTAEIEPTLENRKLNIGILVRYLREMRLDIPRAPLPKVEDNVVSFGSHKQSRDNLASADQTRSLVSRLLGELEKWTDNDNAQIEASLVTALAFITANTARSRRENVEVYIQDTVTRYSDGARMMASA